MNGAGGRIGDGLMQVAPSDVSSPPAAPRWIPLVPVLLAAGVLIASFLKSDLTTNDFERFDDLRLTFLYFALFGSACFGYALLFLEPRSVTARGVVGGALGAGLLLLAAYPIGSKDPIGYAFFGKVWGTYHANPYLVAPAAFPDDPWQPFIQVVWAQWPAPYGPLFLWQARLVDGLAGGHLFVAVWLHKLVATGALVLALLVAARLLKVRAPVERWHALVLLAWNPLLLFESAGTGHNDAVMMLSVLGAAWMLGRDRGAGSLWASAPLVLGVWYKWYALLFVPAFLIAAYRDGGVRAATRWTAASVGIGVATGALLLAPLAEAVPTLVHGLLGHGNVWKFYPTWLSPILAPLLWGLDALGLIGGRWDMAWFNGIRVALFGTCALTVLVAQWRGMMDLVGALCLLAVAFTMLLVAGLQPWHLEVPVVLALVAGTRRWQALGVVLTLVALLSYFFTFVWAAALLVGVATTVWLVRRMQPVRT